MDGFVSPRRSRRRGALGAAAVIIGGTALIVALVAVTGIRFNGPQGPDRGTFAGYETYGRHVDSVSASWVVPRTLPAGVPPADSLFAAPSASSIWVGAQAPGRQGDAPFIQVGVQIVRSPGSAVTDFGFWTDTDHGFHPLPFGIVSPGDHVRASLRLHDGRWSVALIDTTVHVSDRVSTHQEGAASFNLAEWVQEDPAHSSDPRHPDPVPYATTAPVHITDPRVNGAAPGPGRSVTQWMTLPHATLAPTALTAAGFTIRPRG